VRLQATGTTRSELTPRSEGRHIGDHTWRHLVGALEKQLCSVIVWIASLTMYYTVRTDN
jgi:hypothetical protein